MAGKHDVYIVNVGGEYRVRPAVAAVEKTLKIRNVTAEPAVLMFPPNIIVEGDVQTLQPREKKTFNIVATAQDAVAYSVFVSKNGEAIIATGESGPRLIIDP
jgi:hypothetical protein